MSAERRGLGAVFLGKPLHWLLLLIAFGLFWWAGEDRLHVIYFNSFVGAILVGSVALVLLILVSTRPGEQVTRDEIRLPEDG